MRNKRSVSLLDEGVGEKFLLDDVRLKAIGKEAPKPKYLSGNAPKLTSTNDSSFVDLPKTDEPDLPFN